MKLNLWQNGFSMIEIMSAVAVLSVGLVSVASLSLVNLRTVSHGHSQTQATIIAAELADTMRANMEAYENNMFAVNLQSGEKDCIGDEKCQYDEQAQYDGNLWTQHATDALPGATAVMCMDSTPDDGTPSAPACDGLGMNTVKLFWTDTRTAGSLPDGESAYRHVLSLVP
jgi:type IV pilus assembly protein PilV